MNKRQKKKRAKQCAETIAHVKILTGVLRAALENSTDFYEHIFIEFIIEDLEHYKETVRRKITFRSEP